MRVSQRSIAKKLGLSQQAVSKALRGDRDISENVRRQVSEIAEALGYQSNRLARSLIEGKTHVIGVLFPNFTWSFFANMLEAIEIRAKEKGYRLLIQKWNLQQKEDTHELNTLLEYKVDGLLVMPRCNRPWLETVYPQLVRNGTKIVSITQNIPVPGVGHVYSNDLAGAADAVSYLVHAGRRNIAYIGPVSSYSTDQQDRLNGYRHILEQHHLILNNDYIIDNTDNLPENVAARIEKTFSRHPELDAIFCFEDKIAMQALKVLRKMGIPVPEQVSIVGYGDNLPFPEEFKLPLTTVSQFEQVIGGKAVNILCDMLDGQPARDEIIQPRLIKRESVVQKEGN